MPPSDSRDLAPQPKTAISAGARVAGIVPTDIDQTYRLAQALAGSGMIPEHYRGKPGDIMAAVMRGAEVGLAPMQALSSIAVINGRATLWGDAISALVLAAGHALDWEVTGEGDDMVATATLTRKDGRKIVRSFSMAEAQRAGLTNKNGPWKQYPTRMLAMRARAFAVRDGAADVLMGLGVADEVDDYRGPDRARDITPPSAAEDRLRARAAQLSDPTPAPSDDEWETDELVEASAAESVDLDAPEPEPAPKQPTWLDPAAGFPGDKAWTKGAAAYAAGKPADANPYVASGMKPEACSWAGGWQQAEAEDLFLPKEAEG